MLPFVRMLEYGNIAPEKPKITAIYGSNANAGLAYSNGEFYVRGKSNLGQLGNGTATRNNMWYKVVSPDASKIIDIWLGYETSFMWTEKNLYVSGSMRACGILDYNLPVWSTFNISGVLSTDILKVQSSQNSSFVLLKNGDLYASGLNSFGEFGRGNTTSSSQWVRIITGIKDIFLSGDNATSWIIKNDNTIWRAGYGLNGELVNGSKTSSSTWSNLALPSGRELVQFQNQYGYCITMLLRNTSTGVLELWGGGFARYGNFGDGNSGAVLNLKQLNNLGLEIKNLLISKNSANSVTLFQNMVGSTYFGGNNVFYPLGSSTSGNTFAAVRGFEANPTLGAVINYVDGLFVVNNKLYRSGNQKTVYNTDAYVFTFDDSAPYMN